MTKKKVFIAAGIIVLLALIIWKNASRSDSGPAKPIAVQMEKVRRKTIEQVVSATGNIKPVVEVNLSANISAEIREVFVKEGDNVQAGQTLVILDSLKYAAALRQAESALSAARASEKQVRLEYRRAKQLLENKLISDQEFEALDASLKLREAEVKQASERVTQARDDLQKTILAAPVAGTITSLQKEVGEMALGSVFQADVILTISDLSAMEVVVKVDETDVVNIALGNPVKVDIDALPDTQLKGSVTQIAQSAQTNIQTGSQDQVIDYEVRVLIDMQSMDDRIRPGMSATANITTAVSENAIAIPIQALTARPENERPARSGKKDKSDKQDKVETSLYDIEKDKLIDVVFVATRDSTGSGGFSFGRKKEKFTVSRRPVTVGISSANFYEVKAGLEEGELLVVGNYKAISKELKDGSPVTRKKTGTRKVRGRRNGGGE
ncbi:MAG: efflux RND transporter periplasmic adaptor subunit [FCB group bacterium]|nr:efflux RND transporter periplasmic adaptor subunit [FCB group bacterium]